MRRAVAHPAAGPRAAHCRLGVPWLEVPVTAPRRDAASLSVKEAVPVA